jgi:hypothetical protein
MKLTQFLSAALTLAALQSGAQITDPKATEVWEPEPRIVTPGEENRAPSDAIILFDGKKYHRMGFH